MRRNLLFLPSLLSLLALAVFLRADAPPSPHIVPVVAPPGAPAQQRAVDETQLPAGVVSLDDGWRVHMGDDPAFASQAFDDSGWQRTSLARDAQNIVPGMRWYRLRVKLPAQHQPLALLIVGPAGAYEIFANGERTPGKAIGSLWSVYRDHESVVPLENIGSDVQLAIRVDYSPLLAEVYDFSIENVLLGSPEAVETERALYQQKRVSLYFSSAAIDLGTMLLGIGVFILYFLRRSSREFLWLGLYLTLTSVNWAIFVAVMEGALPPAMNAFADPLTFIILICQIEFTYAFAGKRVGRVWRAFEWIILPLVPLSASVILGFWHPHPYLVAETLIVLPVAVLLPVILFRWLLGGNREAGWLIVASLLPSLAVALVDIGTFASFFGWNGLASLALPIHLGSLGFYFGDLANLFFLLSIGILMLFRFIRVSREQARSGAELEAAREIQRRLVPSSLPSISGYRIEAAYLPAQEVGGDFYQVMERKNGSTLVVVGDVSGKGLKAAMTGTLAIGALRTLSAEGLGPAELLTRLNREMLRAQDGGFITCLCARIAGDGTITLANAGHLAPYRNGEEVGLPAGLPLGITEETAWSEISFELEPGDALTFLSDGVIEARNAAGELFGFERTVAISREPAPKIALAAQAFGQEDDITVLTLTFALAEVLHT